MTAPQYSTSSYSSNGGACVEVAVNLASPYGTVPVRDSKDPEGPALGLATTAFASFVAGIKAGNVTVRP
ncbi:DUF397 domain-containing protein [uncultured Streptomyces sp.]|uniref:DUF397 domain-containing protein n=1 Tax=uncultured Streptomyces sp. TaxID=174707 RepID=UPI002621EEF4|nr:DUF397 domain-containing protein [uncultured Streptomyces sp.]